MDNDIQGDSEGPELSDIQCARCGEYGHTAYWHRACMVCGSKSHVSARDAEWPSREIDHATTMQPKRGDEVEAWLKHVRDEYPHGYGEWNALDNLLDEYRLRADTGLTLDRPIEEAGP